MSVDVDAIEAAEKAMTPGPWGSEERGHPRLGYDVIGPDGMDLSGVRGMFDERADATGIALLRNAAPDLIARIREQDAEIERLKCACSKQDDAICQTLGKALGYPRYSDDPKNFPGATGAEVCVGDHVAESLADEAAREIRRLREACEDYLKWVRTPHHHLPIEETVKQRREILERMEAALEQKGGAT